MVKKKIRFARHVLIRWWCNWLHVPSVLMSPLCWCAICFLRCWQIRAACSRRDTAGKDQAGSTKTAPLLWDTSHPHTLSVHIDLFTSAHWHTGKRPNTFSFSALRNAFNELDSLSLLFIVKVKDYDYYGAYDVKKNVNYKYNELLGREYTFDFPPHHDVVRHQTHDLFRAPADSQRLNVTLNLFFQSKKKSYLFGKQNKQH